MTPTQLNLLHAKFKERIELDSVFVIDCINEGLVETSRASARNLASLAHYFLKELEPKCHPLN